MSSPSEVNLDVCRVTAPLSVLLTMTEQQRERLEVLCRGFIPRDVGLSTDMWNRANIEFTLHGPNGEHYLSGLIEPDGRAHT